MEPRIKAIIEKEYAPQRSEEWLALREGMLTASDVATVINQNPYEKPRDLLLKKCGLKTFSGNAATQHGNELEDTAREMYDEQYGQKTHEIGLYPHPTIPWLGGSADGLTESGRLVEIKCPLSRDIGDGSIPGHYMPQVQLLMHILDLSVCDFVQYKPAHIAFPKPAQFTVVEVPRQDDWFDKHYPTMKAFWDQVVWHRAHPGHLRLPQTRGPRKTKEKPKEKCEII